MEIGGLKTADPLDPAVAAWWRTKVDEIYRDVSDFGGFIVKANSEGQPGPAGLQAHPRRRRQHAGRRRRPARRHRDVARVRLLARQRRRPRDSRPQTEFEPLDGTVPRQRDRADQERPARLHAARAVLPALRRTCRRPGSGSSCRSRRNTSGSPSSSPTSAPMWKEVLDADTYAERRRARPSRRSSTAASSNSIPR